MIFPRAFGLFGLQMSQPLSDIFAALIAALITGGILKELKEREKKEL